MCTSHSKARRSLTLGRRRLTAQHHSLDYFPFVHTFFIPIDTQQEQLIKYSSDDHRFSLAETTQAKKCVISIHNIFAYILI